MNSKNKNSSKKKSGVIRLILTVALISVFIGAYFIMKNFSGDSPLDASNVGVVEVEIEKGSTPAHIGELLAEKKIIRDKSVFLNVAKEMNAMQNLKAGTYLLSPSMKPSRIVEIIVAGRSESGGIKVVIPEGYNNREIVDRLVDNGLGKREKYFFELKKGKFKNGFIREINRKYALEGFLFPATYSFEKTDTEHDIIQKMLDTFEINFKPEYYKRIGELKTNLEDVVILASIVEKEARRDDERKTIAGVFKNRLKINMPLQSCSTVQYALGKSKPVLSLEDTRIQNPYNTYINKGLTPGPIASPSTASIEAVLYPDKTDCLFFVVKNLGDGSHYFSKTYEEHKAAIKKSNENLNKK